MGGFPHLEIFTGIDLSEGADSLTVTLDMYGTLYDQLDKLGFYEQFNDEEKEKIVILVEGLLNCQKLININGEDN